MQFYAVKTYMLLKYWCNFTEEKMSMQPFSYFTCSSGDWVFLPDEMERQEYVMNEQGIIYRGSANYISSMSWDFGQVHTPTHTPCSDLQSWVQKDLSISFTLWDASSDAVLQEGGWVTQHKLSCLVSLCPVWGQHGGHMFEGAGRQQQTLKGSSWRRVCSL